MNIETALKVCKYARIVNTTTHGDRQIEIRTPADHKDPDHLIGRYWSFEDYEHALGQDVESCFQYHPESKIEPESVSSEVKRDSELVSINCSLYVQINDSDDQPANTKKTKAKRYYSLIAKTLKKVDVYMGDEETKDINEAKVVDIEPMSEHGFIVVRFTHAEEKYSMAACLEADIVALTVKKSDSGMTWGNCGDSNSEAFEVFGQEAAIEWFFKQIEGHVAII